MEVERTGRPWEAAARLAILAVAVVASMSLAQDVLKPLALAVLLSFVLAPVARFAERRLPRVLAVSLTVALALGALGSLGYVVASELTTLADDLPKYQARIERKVAQLVPSQQSAFSKAADVVQRIDEMIAPRRGRAAVPEVKVVPEVAYRERFEATLGPYLRFLGVGSIVLVLVVFLLLQREDMSDRISRLFGQRRIGLTTRTLDEAGRRTSRYLAAVTAVNAGYGLVVGLGLWAIGVPQPVLWGALAGVLRFIPYVGVAAGFVLPLLLSMVASDGWREPLLVAALFGTLEVLVVGLLEPVLYGRTTGVSSVGLLVAAMFWAWLWGPIGLLLSTPLTLSLAVVGRYAPQLGFFATLLGGEPALAEPLRLYRRLIADDRSGARAIFEAALQRPRESLFDELLVPALARTAADRAAGEIDEAGARRVGRAVDDYLDELEWAATGPAAGPGAADDAASAPPPAATVLGVAEADSFDPLVLRMLGLLLAEWGVALEIVPALRPPEALAAALAARSPAGVVLSALQPRDPPSARQAAAAALRVGMPGLPVVVGEWAARDPGDDGAASGAAVRSVAEARDRVVVTVLPGARMVRLLGQALLAGDRQRFDRLYALAAAHWPLDRVCVELVEPLLDALEAGRGAGRLDAVQAAEARRHLALRLLPAVNAVREAGADAPRALVACPGEGSHDLATMMLTLSLRARGWDVLDLGNSVDAGHVPRAVAALRPHLVVLSASRPDRAEALAAAAAAVAGAAGDGPRPVVACAGAGFAEVPAAAADLVLPPGIGPRLDAIERRFGATLP